MHALSHCIFQRLLVGLAPHTLVLCMPKLRTTSGAKKRFSLTALGRLRSAQANKKHGMRKRSKSQIRNLRGTTILEGRQVNNVKRFFLPYA